MTVRGALRNRTALAAELGLANAILYVADRLLSGLSGARVRIFKYDFMAQPVPHAPWLCRGRGASIVVRRLFAGDAELAELPRPASVIASRFKQGAICLGAFAAGSLIGQLWVVPGAYREDEVRCSYVPLPPGRAAWDFDVYVAPQHRAGFVFLRLWDAANQLLNERGIQWSISRISAFNPASILSHRRMAARRVASAIFIVIGGWQLSLASISPRVFLSRRERSFPQFSIDPSLHG